MTIFLMRVVHGAPPPGRCGEAVEVWPRDEIGAVAQGKRKHRGKGERRAPGIKGIGANIFSAPVVCAGPHVVKLSI